MSTVFSVEQMVSPAMPSPSASPTSVAQVVTTAEPPGFPTARAQTSYESSAPPSHGASASAPSSEMFRLHGSWNTAPDEAIVLPAQSIAELNALPSHTLKSSP